MRSHRTVSWVWASNTGFLQKWPTLSSVVFRSAIRAAQGNLSFLYPQCWWDHVKSAKSSPGLPSTDKFQTDCSGSSTVSEILLWNGAAAYPRSNSRYCNFTSVPHWSSQPPYARDGCYPAQDQQGWSAASHCRANEGASSPCSPLLAAPRAHQGYSLPRWEIKWEWQLLSRFYSAVGSCPGAEGEDMKCGSKAIRQASTAGLCFTLSLQLSSCNTRVAKALAGSFPASHTNLPAGAVFYALLRAVRLHQPLRRDTVPAQTLSPAQGSLQDQDARRSQCPDDIFPKFPAQSSSGNFHHFFSLHWPKIFYKKTFKITSQMHPWTFPWPKL